MSFLNTSVAERFHEEMNKSLVVSTLDIEHFVSVHLSDVDIKKLVITLRVYLKINIAERLQVDITSCNKKLLDKLVKVSGKTKIQIIN
jgi:hypothetical protein